MSNIFSSPQDFLTLLLQALLVGTAISAAWMYSRYLRSVQAQNRLSLARRLAEAAVEYVEDLDSRGELGQPAGSDRNAQKRELAAQRLISQMQEAGFAISAEQAHMWIAVESHQRSISQPPLEKIAELARASLDVAQRLEQAHLVEPPANVNSSVFLAGLAADWLTAEMAKSGVNLSRDQAATWVRGEILHRLQTQAAQATVEDPLARLAREAVEFMENLKASGRLTIHPGAAGGSVEMDVATGYLITEVAKRGLAVTADQIYEAIDAALQPHSERIALTLTSGE
jgi:hypothetical protein